MRLRRRSIHTRVTLTGRIAALAGDRLLLGRGGATIYYTPGSLPYLKVGDMVAVVTIRVGSKNLAEKITRVRSELTADGR